MRPAILDSSRREFPPVEQATPEGLLAVGGDLDCDLLLCAYRSGIFPWYEDEQPVLWWSPDPRSVLWPGDFRISRDLARVLRGKRFEVTMDRDFVAVIEACSALRRDTGTWIVRDMIDAYCALHDYGYAHSVECRLSGELVGGLYGLSLGRVFFGESMFSTVSNASKVALAHLVRCAREWDFHFIDCQIPSRHLASLGAVNIARDDYMKHLAQALQYPDRLGDWGDAAPTPADIAPN